MKLTQAILSFAFSLIPLSQGAVITFAGGTVTYNEFYEFIDNQQVTIPGGTAVTTNTSLYRNVQNYVESGFVFEYVGGTGGSLGDYYFNNDGNRIGNAVIHAHFGTGEMTGIEIYKQDGGTFDFNYLLLTSNTLEPGEPATGFEDVHISGWLNGSQVGIDVIAPPEDFNFPATALYFGSDFDLVDKITITSTHTSFSCYGMDSFYIDQAAPMVPEPTGVSLAALGVVAFLLRRKRRN